MIFDLLLMACLIGDASKCVEVRAAAVPTSLEDCIAIAPKVARAYERYHPGTVVPATKCKPQGRET